MLKYIKIARAHIAEVLHQKQEEARRAAEAVRSCCGCGVFVVVVVVVVFCGSFGWCCCG